MHLSELIGRPIVAESGQRLGKLSDVIVRLPERGAYPVVSGLVGKVAGRQLYVTMKKVKRLGSDEIRLSSAKLDLRPFERREGEVLLRQDLLGHRLIEVSAAKLVRAHDAELTQDAGRWQLTRLDTVRRRRLFGLLPPAQPGERHASHDWSEFEPLIGHSASVLTRRPLHRLQGLRAAQIADLVEEADKRETDEILQAVHDDAELEADVFEEMESDRQVEVLKHRSDAEVAEVLLHMRADDAADLIADLPQERRIPLLALLPAGVQVKIRTLLGFNPATAGGLMNPDFLALPGSTPIGTALTRVGQAKHIPHEVLAILYLTDEGRLSGALSLAAMLQADPAARLGDISERNPVHVHADADVIEVAIQMTDFNLLTIPVVDDERQLLGVITVDDLLEVTIPEDWRRREDGAAASDSRSNTNASSGEPPQLTANSR